MSNRTCLLTACDFADRGGFSSCSPLRGRSALSAACCEAFLLRYFKTRSSLFSLLKK